MLSEKFDGSNGMSKYSDGVQIRGPPSFEIAICFDPLLLTTKGPSVSLEMFGKVDIAFCLSNSVLFSVLNAVDVLSLVVACSDP